MEFQLFNYDIEVNLKYFFGIQLWEKGNTDPLIQFSYSGFPYKKLSSIVHKFIKYEICCKPYYMIFDYTITPFHYSINPDIYDPNDF